VGAKFEVYIRSKNYINIEDIQKILNINSIYCNIEEMIYMDNWEFDNCLNIRYDSKQMRKLIQSGKIIILYIILNDIHFAGIQCYKENDTNFITNFWIDTTNIVELDCDIINKKNKGIYDNITHIICQNIQQFEMYVIALGSEMYINDSGNIESVILNSSNVNRWIIIHEYNEEITGYTYEYNSEYNCRIYTKI
jgi:hypothetical protein